MPKNVSIVTENRTNKGNIENIENSDHSAPIEIPLAPYWLPAIIESAEDAIVSKTLDGIITSWNESAERIFGYTADEIVGKSILVLIPHRLRDEETHILSKIRNGERVEHFETLRLRKDGTEVDISLTVSPIRTPDGTIIGASKIARDITDQKRAERERQVLLYEAEEARSEAERSNRAKDNFLALLSHELRTPLHSMRGWLSMLNKGLLTEDQGAKALEVILRGIDTQNSLIEDLLDVSRIASGKMSINHEKVSLVSIVGNTVEQLRPFAEENGIKLSTNLDAAADEVIGDPIRLHQIVTNVINNAIKYTYQGGKIDVVLKREDGDAAIVVSDTGVGIDNEMLERIFERFEQSDSSSRRAFGGLGLGLTIARHLTELHGGNVTAESAGEGKGSRFTIHIPLMKGLNVPPRNPFVDQSYGSYDEPKLENTKVLIVEDDLDSQEMLRLVLETSGAEVVSVDRSQKAVEELIKRKFDVMISDLGLPGMDGHDLIREIRGSLGIDARALPAIALSGYVAEDDRNRSLSNGFQMHLQKPLDVTTLASIIKSLLEAK